MRWLNFARRLSTKMKTFLFLSLILISTHVQARTEGRFLGLQYMINITSSSIDGTFDHTPARLFEQMNVPEQSSMLGPAKALVVSQKEMTFICNKKQENNYHCSIIIFKSNFGTIGFKSALVKYTGAKAQEMFAQFFPNQDGSEINITDDTGQFNLIVRPELFQLKFNQQ